MLLLPLNGSVAKVAHSPLRPLDCRLAYRRPTVTNSRRATTLYITLLTLYISTTSVQDGNLNYMARRFSLSRVHARASVLHARRPIRIQSLVTAAVGVALLRNRFVWGLADPNSNQTRK